MRFKTKIAIVVFSTIIAFYAIVGSFMSKQGQVVARGSQYGQLQIFDEVLSHIIRDYVDQPDLEKVRIGSLRGLAEGLDPYSAYLTPEQVKQYDPKASRAETGLLLSKVGGYAYTVAVLKGSPAEQAGIRSGDFIEYLRHRTTTERSARYYGRGANPPPGPIPKSDPYTREDCSTDNRIAHRRAWRWLYQNHNPG
jgi:carboxyl-terminal processing protease